MIADPLYRYTKEQIAQRIKDTQNEVLDETKKNEYEFVWSTISFGRGIRSNSNVRYAGVPWRL